ncbi:MAG: phage tail protein [Bacteroidales bacterium]|nr:phage tail protein [Bacteroidales bacterium]
MSYRLGVNLILGVVVTENNNDTFKPLGYSTGCKISDSTETGERVTKETGASQWKEKYVKSLSEQITADGFVYDGVAASSIGFPDLKSMWLSKEPVKLRYQYRDDAQATKYEGDFIITSLEQDGPADDDEKWSITFENSGAVAPVS